MCIIKLYICFSSILFLFIHDRSKLQHHSSESSRPDSISVSGATSGRSPVASSAAAAAPGAPPQESYVNGLLQQIKLLELEISYLKQHPNKEGERSISSRKESGDR